MSEVSPERGRIWLVTAAAGVLIVCASVLRALSTASSGLLGTAALCLGLAGGLAMIVGSLMVWRQARRRTTTTHRDQR